MSWRSVRLVEAELIVRSWEPGDRERLGISTRDPEIGRYFGSVADAGGPAVDDPAAPVLALVESGAVVGCMWFRRGARPFEVGYYLRQDAWGRGLATRSLRLVSDWMVSERGADLLVLCTHPDNVRSQSVALRAGYRPDGEIARYAVFKDGSTRALRFVFP
jgi:RimJ/RimL family protein N-acetyltransferase